MKKLHFTWAALLMGAITLGNVSCSDFFDTDPKDIIKEKDYIDKEDEIYKGFLGIITRMQEAGDQSIILTDTRCNVIETTENAPKALQSIYNFDNTDGNEYADPSCYYAIVVACNDYFNKMAEYHHNAGGMSESAETNFKALLSMAIRLKVWAYIKLGGIYGQAYWFDDPLRETKDLTDTSIFTKCDMGQLASKTIDLLENGIDVDGVHINSDTNMNWATWLDEENQDESQFAKWYYMVPPRVLLEAEMRSWRASYESEDAAQSDWLWVRDNLLQYMHNIHKCAPGYKLNPLFDFTSVNNTDWQRSCNIYQLNAYVSSGVRDEYYPYLTIFPTEEVGNKFQSVSSILYDYTNHQRNRLVQYFCPNYPSAEAYYLRPSAYGQSIYGENDLRSMTQKIVMNQLGGKDAIVKYYYYYNRSIGAYEYVRNNIFEIEPAIPLYRGHDFHFLIAEAENHLGNWQQANAILNNGLLNVLVDKKLPEGWNPNYDTWLGNSVQTLKNDDGTNKSQGGYGNIGIVGAMRGTEYDLPTVNAQGTIIYKGQEITEAERRQIVDWALADEYSKEFVAEGKSYSYLCKIGERYANQARGGNASQARGEFASRIAPNHKSNAGKVTSYQDGVSDLGYFIKWNLKD